MFNPESGKLVLPYDVQIDGELITSGATKISGPLSVGPEENVIISKAEGGDHIVQGGETGMIKLKAKNTNYGIIRGYKSNNTGGVAVPNLLWIKDGIDGTLKVSGKITVGPEENVKINVHDNGKTGQLHLKSRGADYALIRGFKDVNSKKLYCNDDLTVGGNLGVSGDNATFGARENIKFVKGNHNQGEIKLRNGTNINSVKNNYESIQGYGGALYIPGKSIFKKKAHFQLPQKDGNSIEVGHIKVGGRLYIGNNYVDSIELDNNKNTDNRMETCHNC